MQTITTKLEESRARLVQQGTLFVQQTGAAATTFVEKTKKAGEKFASETKKASDLLALSTTNAGKTFSTGITAEARTWFASFEASAKLPALPRDFDVSKVPSPRALEREVLLRVEKAIDVVAHRLHDRVLFLDTLTGPQLPADAATVKAAKTNGAAKPTSVTKPGGAPISGYDELSAKDIVAKLERLSDDKTAAVIAYENANKKRATILRAAEQRLSEA